MRGAALIALALTAISASPAAACSFSWREGHSPEDIRARDDVRLVHGTFRPIQASGQSDGNGVLARGVILGEIRDRAGRTWPTTQDFDQFAAECGAILTPTADATGRFWVTRRRTDNRYRLMLWEGRYLPRAGTPPERVN